MKTILILQRRLFFSISNLTTNFNQLSNRSISLVRKSAFLVCIGLLGFNSWGQIAQRGTATTATSTTTSVTVIKPTGLAVGDVLIATINQADNDDNSLSNATLTGWQLIGGAKFYTLGNDEWWGTVLYKIATASDVSAADFTFLGDGDADDMQASIIAFSGVDQNNPIDITSAFTSSTEDNTSLIANSITTTTNNAAIIMLAMISDNTSFTGWSTTSPTGLTELFDNPFDADLDMGIAGAWAIKTTAGLTGNGSVTLTGNARDGAMMIALRAAGSSGFQTFTSNSNFNVPCYVSTVTVEAWGGGGGGGSRNGRRPGGGGGGGAYARANALSVTPGSTISVTVGNGGTGASDANGNTATSGGSSTFGTQLTAPGGNGGSGRNGGNGGIATNGNINFEGGDGGDGDNDDDRGGAGGGAAGNQNSNGQGGRDSNGSNGGSGGVGILGAGNGGAGGNNDVNGNNGVVPGGGGGGEGGDGTGSADVAGNGGAGRVIVSWACPSATIAYSSASFCTTVTSALVTITGTNATSTCSNTFSSTTGLSLNTTTGAINPSLSTPGIYTITYSLPAQGGCAAVSATASITISAAPSAGTLSGTQAICSNGTTTLSSTVSGGAWSSSNTAIATINSSGLVTGVAAGTATMTYTVTGTGGCSNATAPRVVTVTAAPSAGTLSGTQAICSNGTTTLASTVSGGAWSSSNSAIATINSSGLVTGVAAGTATMTYTVTGTGGCSNAAATRVVTVTAAPSAGILSGTQSLCLNGTTTLSSTVSGGAWSSSATGIATINGSSGVVSGVSAGTATMTYTFSGTGGCANATATRVVSVSQPSTSIIIDSTTIGNGDYLWNGNINSNGNVSGNWYVLNNGIYSVPNQAPQGNHEVFVVSPSQAVSCVSNSLTIPNAGNFSSENIHIGQDANVSVGNEASLNVRGNFVNNGNVNAGNGFVNFTGNSAVQFIRGTGTLNFTNVRIAKSQGVVRLSNDISISGILDFEQGNLDLNGKTLTYSGGYGITTTNGGLIGDAVQSKLNLTTSSQITDGLFQSEIYDLTIADNASVSSSGSYTISNSLIVGNDATFTKEDGYTIIFKGDVVNNGSIIDGTSGIFGGSIVFNNTVNQTISGQPVSIANLEVVKASGKLIVSTPITVTGKLEMNGNIDNPSSLITLGNSSEPGSLIYTSGTITGALRRYFPSTPGSSTYFPVGNTSNTRGATIAFTSSPGANQYLTVKYQGGAAGGTAPLYTGLPLTTGDGVLIQNFDEEGYWEINPTANDYAQSINTTPYTITLQMKNLSNVNDRSTVRIIKAAGSNNSSQHHSAWTALTFDANAVSGNSNSDFTVTGTSTGFSWFGAGSGNNNPLPVELVSFSGLCEEGVVNLTWQTASEFNSSHFDVEKSRDGENWQLLSTVPSAGTSNELITYQSFDKNGTNGNNYYRLRQVDIDGTEKVYDPINVSCTEETPGYFSSFPNPSGTSFQVVVNNKELIGTCTLNMVDATGKVMEQREIEVNEGINMFVINQELNPGIYFLNITNGSKSTSILRHAIK